MNLLQLLALLLIAVAVVLSLVRLLRGPTTPDRVVAADALVVITTPALVWLASALGNPVYVDIALVYGALGFVGVIAVARTLEGNRG